MLFAQNCIVDIHGDCVTKVEEFKNISNKNLDLLDSSFEKYSKIFSGETKFNFSPKKVLNFLSIFFLSTIRSILSFVYRTALQLGIGEKFESFPLIFISQAIFSGAVINSLLTDIFFINLITFLTLFS